MHSVSAKLRCAVVGSHSAASHAIAVATTGMNPPPHPQPGGCADGRAAARSWGSAPAPHGSPGLLTLHLPIPGLRFCIAHSCQGLRGCRSLSTPGLQCVECTCLRGCYPGDLPTQESPACRSHCQDWVLEEQETADPAHLATPPALSAAGCTRLWDGLVDLFPPVYVGSSFASVGWFTNSLPQRRRPGGCGPGALSGRPSWDGGQPRPLPRPHPVHASAPAQILLTGGGAWSGGPGCRHCHRDLSGPMVLSLPPHCPAGAWPSCLACR